MIKSVEHAKQIAKQYNSLKTDMEKLAFLKENYGKLKVILDNDSTKVEFDEIEDCEKEEQIREIRLKDFEYFHGDDEGVFLLFQFAGIKAEGC